MENKPIQKWEYKVERSTDNSLEWYLNTRTEEGWFLINTPEREKNKDGSYFVLIFKRPKV